MSDVTSKVTKIIVDQLGVSADEVKPEAKFVDDLGADSLDLTELIMAMEETSKSPMTTPRRSRRCRTPSITSRRRRASPKPHWHPTLRERRGRA